MDPKSVLLGLREKSVGLSKAQTRIPWREIITTYTLIHKYGINPRTINNLKHNKSITMFTLERLCEILNCEPNDVIRFEKK